MKPSPSDLLCLSLLLTLVGACSGDNPQERDDFGDEAGTGTGAWFGGGAEVPAGGQPTGGGGGFNSVGGAGLVDTSGSAASGGFIHAGATSGIHYPAGGSEVDGTGGAFDPNTPSAGGSDGGNASVIVIEASFATAELVITYAQPACAGTPCHGGRISPRLSRANLYENLLTGVSKACGDLPLVDPGNSAGSALVKILRGPCGKVRRMPPCSMEDGNCIPDPYIDAIETWIDHGAAFE